jgi:hypothetical protein
MQRLMKDLRHHFLLGFCVVVAAARRRLTVPRFCGHRLRIEPGQEIPSKVADLLTSGFHACELRSDRVLY